MSEIISFDDLAVKGMNLRRTKAGSLYCQVHHYADPDKQSEWLEQEREKMADTPREFEVEILMKELMLDGAPVYNLYRDQDHAPDILNAHEIPVGDYSQWVCGWDCGTGSVNPAAILIQITAKTLKMPRLICAMHEWTTEPGTSLEVFVPAVMDAIRRKYPEIDMDKIEHGGDETGRNKQGATGISGFEVMQSFGVFCNPVSNQWQRRRNAVDKALNYTPDNVTGFLINRQFCPVLIDGFNGGYRLRQITSGSSSMYGDPIKDRYSDCIAEGSLVTTARGEIPIESVVAGDYALTRKGFRKVLRAWKVSDSSPIMELELSCGRKLRATKDHRIGLKDKFVRLDALQYGTIVEVCETSQNTSKSYLTGSDSAGTPMQSNQAVEITTMGTSVTEKSSFIGTFGQRLMARFRKVCTFTTSTATSTTTLSKIWNALRQKSILGNMRTHCANLVREALNWRKSRQSSGISQIKAENGILNKLVRVMQSVNQENLNVRGAVLSCHRPSFQATIFATPLANNGGVVVWGLITSKKPALFAGHCSSHINKGQSPVASRVLTKKPVGSAAVYDLEVEDCHEFYANGILVHNCHDALQYALVTAWEMMGSSGAISKSSLAGRKRDATKRERDDD